MGNGAESRIQQYVESGVWVTAGSIAERIGVNRHGGLYEALREAGIDELKIGNHSLFEKEGAERFIAKRRLESERPVQRPLIPAPVVAGENNAGKLAHRIKEVEAKVENITTQLTKIANAFGGWGQFEKLG